MNSKIFHWGAALILSVYVAFILIQIASNPESFQWDFAVYYWSAKAQAEGLNPYDPAVLSLVSQTDMYHQYVYHPLTLWLFRPFALFDYPIAQLLFLVFKCIALAALLGMWHRFFLRPYADLPFYFFCLFAFNSTLYLDLRAGNISLIEQALLWSGLYCFLRGRLALFCVLVIGAAIFKGPPLLFIGLLWFSNERLKYAYMLAAATGYGLLLLLSRLSAPDQWQSFLDNVGGFWDRGIINPATLPLIRDSIRFAGKVTGWDLPDALSLIVFALVVLGVAITSYKAWSRLRASDRPDGDRLEVMFACMIFALALPRLKDYSYILLLAPAYYILRSGRGAPVFPIVFALCSLGVYHVTLPGLDKILVVFWEYYPLVLAWGLWGLYLYTFWCAGEREGINPSEEQLPLSLRTG